MTNRKQGLSMRKNNIDHQLTTLKYNRSTICYKFNPATTYDTCKYIARKNLNILRLGCNPIFCHAISYSGPIYGTTK